MQISKALHSFAYPSAKPTALALEQLVPGDFPEVERDLSSFSQPVLELLAGYGTRVAVLEEGQTLADSPGLRTMSDSEVMQEAVKANAFICAKIQEGALSKLQTVAQLEETLEAITRDMRLARIENHLGLALRPFLLDDLATRRDIPQEKMKEWKEAFDVLNKGLLEPKGDMLQATCGLVLLPHTYLDGRAVPESRLANARQVTAEFVERSLGLNRPDEKMVLLHQKFSPLPAQEVGNYRVGIHEVGHALDHALEDLVGVPGFGQDHRKRIEALYAADCDKVSKGAEPGLVFTSDRADDDVREYFAEAVEAYLTPENPNGYDDYRKSNSREALATRNPELFSYVEMIMNASFPEQAKFNSPLPSLLPPGIPDPDLDVIAIS